jgi:PAS domain S-box-containing protein
MRADNRDELRRRVEELLKSQPKADLKKLPAEDTERLIHELRVHQIELEMQNDELRRSQEELEASRTKYADLYDFAPVSYFTFDKNGLVLEANLTGAGLLGIERSRLINKPFSSFIEKDCQDLFYLHCRKVFDAPERQTCEIRLRKKDGADFHAHMESIQAGGPQGEISCRTSVIDITGRRQAEETLKKVYDELEIRVKERTSELNMVNEQLMKEVAGQRRTEEKLLREKDKLEAYIETTAAIVIILNPDQTVALINGKGCEILGYARDEVLGKNWFDHFLPEENRDNVKNVFDMMMAGAVKPVEHFENYVLTKSGEKRMIAWHNSVLRDEDGRITGTLATGGDITERKRNDALNASRLHLMQFAVDRSLDELLEETLNEAEKLTGSLIGFYHFVEDDQKSLTLQNWSTRTKAEFCKAKGKGLHYDIAQAGVWVDCVYQRKPVIHNDYASLPHRKGMPPDHAELVRELALPVIRGEKIRAILGVGNKPSDYTENDIEAVSLLANLAWEIAERKRAEERLRASLKEKEVLLREIHHRVKNNMTIVYSLLEMQSRIATDRRHREMLDDAKARIKAMALIHEKLYGSRDLARVDFDNYLRDILKSMFTSYLKDPGRIALKMDVGDIALSIEDAIPCALIINELVANALKHAFPEERKGEITLTMLSDEKGGLELTVADNGIGLPDDLDSRKKKSMGLSLVDALVGQLQGKMELIKKQGTGFRITFTRRK